MAARLFRFDDAPRRIRRLAPPDYAVLAEAIAEADALEAGCSVDFDPRWRTLLLLSHGDDPDSDSPYYSELLVGPGEATATRQEAEVEVKVTPADAGLTVVCAGVPAAHGARRACRTGPSHGHPVLNAHIELTIRGESSLGDLHAAAQQATSRALADAGTAAVRVDGAGNGEVPRFPELETSVAEVVLNLEELCHWPVAEATDNDKKQLGAFLAYQLSLMYGHSVDERMRRVPGAPAVPLRPFMGSVTDQLLAYAADKGDAGEMVSGLVETWTAGWR